MKEKIEHVIEKLDEYMKRNAESGNFQVSNAYEVAIEMLKVIVDSESQEEG